MRVASGPDFSWVMMAPVLRVRISMPGCGYMFPLGLRRSVPGPQSL
jgi:hypothetical protein